MANGERAQNPNTATWLSQDELKPWQYQSWIFITDPDFAVKARIIPIIGVSGCVILAFALPLMSVITGAAVIVLGALIFPFGG